MIDIHSHILPGLDDGPRTLGDAVQMARMAAADGIRVMVATPHLFRGRTVEREAFIPKEEIFAAIGEFKQKLAQEEIPLEILPGCDVPLCLEAVALIEQDQVLTINNGRRYLLLELPDTAIPPATEDVCFRLMSRGLTPIITHPERHFLFYEMPEKLARLVQLGCLVQITAHSLTGGFGRQVARFARQLARQGYVQIVATDAHNSNCRPPVLQAAVQELTKLVGTERARAMVATVPERIIRGVPWDQPDPARV